MIEKALRTGSSREFSIREVLSYAIIAGAVWLGWEVVKSAIIQRGPPALAVTLSPTSPEALRRAAEAELLADRAENAKALSVDALRRAPFNAKALRVRGLVEAETGDSRRANEMLTLAGNWSLRDDPAHAWLMEYRFRRGDYASAFAHADTLARRRADLFPSLFRLFTAAASNDPRSLPVLARLIAAAPPWREAFLQHLNNDENGALISGALALALQGTDQPFSDLELERLYEKWLADGRLQGVRELRTRLRRPPAALALQNGDFKTPLDKQNNPFGWRMGVGPGIGAGVIEDDLRSGDLAYRVGYDGFGSGTLLSQLVMLEAGTYVLSGEQRIEASQPDLRVEWRLSCAEGGPGTIIWRPTPPPNGVMEWTPFSARLVVPPSNCSLQWLQLVANPGDRRTNIAIWYDNIRLRRAEAAPRGIAVSDPSRATQD